MTNLNKAFTETWKILEKFDKNEIKKIPDNILILIKENMDNNYDYVLDENLILSKQNILKETKSILYYLYMNYLASEQEKEKIKKQENLQLFKIENDKKYRFNTEIFKKNKKST